MKRLFKKPFSIIPLPIILLIGVLCHNAFAAIKDGGQTGFWYENRTVILCILIILLIVFYRTAWRSYKKLFQMYRETLPAPTKPPVTPLLLAAV